MEKKYEKIIFPLGSRLENVVTVLVTMAEKREFVCCDFNGVTLYSDTVSMDSACMEVLGMSYFEFVRRGGVTV